MNSRGPFFPKRSLGQNFLINPKIAQRIVAACHLKPTDVILEIGPGKGALTRQLSNNTQKVIAVEKDDYLTGELEENFKDTNVQIVHADILEYPFTRLPDNTTVIGNLPYNIATPIIEKVIHHRDKFNAFYMTVQLEYGQRMAAGPDNKNYGSLSCFIQYYAEVAILFKIKNTAFKPSPKVQSCFLCLDFKKGSKHKAVDEKRLFRIIRACFNQRRKTVQNSLSTILEKKTAGEMLQRAQIDPKSRAETISLEKYVELSNQLAK